MELFSKEVVAWTQIMHRCAEVTGAAINGKMFHIGNGKISRKAQRNLLRVKPKLDEIMKILK